MTLTHDTAGTASQTADAFAERVFAAALGTIETLSIYLGDRLGWYRSLVEDGPASAAELARRTSTSERYAREWLEQQAVCGILLTDARVAADERRYTLPPGAAEVLTDEHSLAYLGPVGRLFAAAGAQLPALLEAYRTGGGVSWEQLGDDARSAQADINRPWFEHQLPSALEAVPHLHETLSRPGARVVEVGFGGGWAAISLARSYPGLRVDGYDVDGPSVEMARRNAEESGVGDRVRFHLAGGADIPERGAYDAAFAFECIHDMPQPVPVLRAMREAVRTGGRVVVMDEAVADRFTAPGDDLERFMYGCSILVCLPDGMSAQPSVGTGTVIRSSLLEDYARQAGFTGLEVLPVEDFGFWRFYELKA